MPGPIRHDDLLAFGRTLRRIRRERDLSQEALGARVGLHPNHVSAIERASKDPRLTTVLQLARGLDMTAQELFAAFARMQDERGDRSW